MRDLASDASKKAIRGVLSKKTDRNREDVLKGKGVREKLRIMIKGQKTEYRKRWKEHMEKKTRRRGVG